MRSTADSVLQSPCGLWMKTRTNAHRLRRSCGEKGTVQILSEDENSMAASLKGRAHRPLPGQAFIVFLRSYIKEGFIIYYIECCRLHFRYNQGNENNKYRRERRQADYALSLGKFIQALEITLKIGSKHLLFQTRVREV